MTSPEAERRRAEEAKAAIDRATRDAEGIFTPSVKRAAGHFAGKDADPADRVEVWGRRVGRALSLVGVVVLFIMLLYQLGYR